MSIQSAISFTTSTTVTCSSCYVDVSTAIAFVETIGPAPRVFLCRRCAAEAALAPFTRRRVGRALEDRSFPRWALDELLGETGAALHASLTVAGALREGRAQCLAA